jgi:CRISPR-associated protein Cmr1
MKPEPFQFELLTPCFCGGAEPDQRAEIRAPSIRGQLRWWFRTLGGFKSLSGRPVREQEAMIFGSIDGNEGRASQLIVRVKGDAGNRLISTQSTMNARVGTERGYVLFPLRNKPRAVFDQPALPKFDLLLVWRGNPSLWSDIQALVTVFGNLGALGFRSRRAMGALSIANAPRSLQSSLACFSADSSLLVRALPAKDGSDAIAVLANWLKNWRTYGRTGKNASQQSTLGFRFAEQDHDIAAKGIGGSAFRPALGLPILSKYGEWHESFDSRKARTNVRYRGEGRFASPVILRPHREIDASGKSVWRALVIFVDAHKWPDGKAVHLNGQPRSVSLELYEAMKNDSRLSKFQ